MRPYFDDLPSFFAMGGHGFFVWLCWGLVMGVVLFGVYYAKAERKRIIKQIKEQHLRQKAVNRQKR
mgnify:FL=1